MDLHAQPQTFKSLFASKKVFSIPRYQREFSWERREWQGMLNDVVKRLIVDGEEIKTTEYFFGNIILQGDMADSNEKELSIIDGQQRFTAVTIFLSALASAFKAAGYEQLENGIKQYVIGKDDDNNEYPVFVNKTPAPFFQFKIQWMNEIEEPKTEEEKRINNAYEFFLNGLQEKTLKASLDYLGREIEYVEALKLVRDQLLGSYVICCWTTTAHYANLIFEIMNAKGLELASIDLIKNHLFYVLDETVPADFASEKWKSINRNLLERDTRIPFPIFFRHYWNSLHGKVSEKTLFTKFKSSYNGKEKCRNLLIDMEKMSKIYVHSVKPMLSDFDNKNQYQHLVESLAAISDTLNVVVPRMFIINLLEKYDSRIIDTKTFEDGLTFIEKFHYIYNGVCSERSNRLDGIYCKYAPSLKVCSSKEECKTVIDAFKNEIRGKLPSFDVFKSRLSEQKFSSSTRQTSNVICRYFAQHLEKKASNLKYNKTDYSIEHIFGQGTGNEEDLTLPYLMLMPRDENSRIPGECPVEEKYQYYNESVYAYTRFVGSRLSKAHSKEEVKKVLDDIFEENAKNFYDSVSQ